MINNISIKLLCVGICWKWAQYKLKKGKQDMRTFIIHNYLITTVCYNLYRSTIRHRTSEPWNIHQIVSKPKKRTKQVVEMMKMSKKKHWNKIQVQRNEFSADSYRKRKRKNPFEMNSLPFFSRHNLQCVHILFFFQFVGWRLNCLILHSQSYFLCVLSAIIDVATGFCVPNAHTQYFLFSHSYAASDLLERKFMSDKDFQQFNRI